MLHTTMRLRVHAGQRGPKHAGYHSLPHTEQCVTSKGVYQVGLEHKGRQYFQIDGCIFSGLRTT